jgi:hypothetical protein
MRLNRTQWELTGLCAALVVLVCVAGAAAAEGTSTIEPQPPSVCVLLAAASSARAADIRKHTRPEEPATTSVTDVQAEELTLTTTSATEQTIQTWVRTSAILDQTGKTLTAEIDSLQGALIQPGQRARAFQARSRASMYQARITRVTQQNDRMVVEAALTSSGADRTAPYLLEIVVDRGRFLAVPNAAIIEEGDKHIVYVQRHPGHYVPVEIHAGIQGELYTQVLHGLDGGEDVVTFGSFFVDAEHKLKAEMSSTDSATGHEHHRH